MLRNVVRAIRSICSSLVGAGILAASLPTQAAVSAPLPLVTQQVDNANRVILHGNVHPLANAANDRGAADASMQAPRMQLLLKRPADRETALKQYIESIHQKNSANYHKWLTPEQIATQYGAADSDVQAVVAWMHSQGFKVNKISRAKSVIEFGGSVAQIQTAFNTSIHKYVVGGETHYANATNPSIPAALAPVVNGVVRLNDFRPKAQAKFMGSATYNPVTHKAKTLPNWTYSNTEGETFFVAPADFAVQYDTTPLTTAGTTGTGQTIGIINDSNIDLTLVNAFRTLFSLPANTPQVIVDGNDPGINGDSDEAYLDVEWSGAIAPAATIDLYIAANTDLGNGLDLAAARAVNDDIAQVLSLSFGECEQFNGTTENAYYNNLWEQAAAQGQTVLVSAGDSGSEACYQAASPAYGVSVNGLGSTPFNVSVGGTDFYYSDYASTSTTTGVPPSFTNYWSTTSSDAPNTTLLKTIPEQPWNDSQFGFDIAAYASDPTDIASYFASEVSGPEGAGGGASACVQTETDDSGNFQGCLSGGYPKPTFQSALTPADSVRDLPDISSFAAVGFNYSATPICALPGDCNTDGNSTTPVTVSGVGGTSVAAPSFAGIMALVDQKYGPQGQADYVLYPLFKQYPAAFHDVSAGSNNELCADPNDAVATCVSSGGVESAGAYSAAAGYDQASGLGTVDANVLVTDWPKVTFTSSTTTLAVSPTTITHGQNVTLTATVPNATTGDVSFTTSVPLPNNKGIGFATVNSSGVATEATNCGASSNTVNCLPGGTYNITAQYAGNGTLAASTSAPQSVTVTPEASNINLVALAIGLSGSSETENYVTNGTSYPYGTQISAEVQPVGTSVTEPSGALPGSGSLVTDGYATGTATFKDTGNAGTSTVALNAQGYAEWGNAVFGVGSHSISATYSGDASFKASSSTTPVTFTITQGTTALEIVPVLTSQQSGSGLTVQVAIGYVGSGTPPSGTVTVTLSNGQTQTATVVPYYYSGTFQSDGGQYSSATVVFSNLPSGVSAISAAYSGDSNWAAATASTAFSTGTGTLQASTTTLSVAPASGNNANTFTFTAAVTGSTSGPAPTGTLTIYDNGSNFGSLTLPSGTVGAPVSFTFTLSGSSAIGGVNQFVAAYSGDTTYAPSSSGPAEAGIDQSDFTLAAQNQLVDITGTTGTDTINLASVNGFNATVNLTCASPLSTVTCSVSPTSVALNGAATAAVTITYTQGIASNSTRPFWFAGASTALAFILFFGIPARNRNWRSMLGLMLFVAFTANLGCGGGGGGGGGGTTTVATPTFLPAAGTYSSTQSVAISTTTSGATIYYTTDGSTPTTSSTKYSAAVSVAASETLNAIATASGDTTSAVGSSKYVITPLVTPTVPSGSNPTIHNVTIQVVTPMGAVTTVVVTASVAS